MIGGTELIILVVVIGVLLFGAAKIPNLQRRLARQKLNTKRVKLKETRN